ncbi:hypothetical protein C2G38_2049723 [Gigaspora rosea]|uniref:Uncharacterized protein n=1 Tax=Gigaspora rosea TaxID=44941 RepID=A0A397U6C8_9GLOM|nr:hypothetical protein C2G38_2049723 [Gigaspora rosea]CAG8466795.1 12007_t:CDS:2 [Gigaspora rosea]
MFRSKSFVKVSIVTVTAGSVAAGKIDSPPSSKLRKKMVELIGRWSRSDIPKDMARKHGTILKGESSMRIDNQGLITRKNEHGEIRYANLQLQYGSRTYANVFVPVDVRFDSSECLCAFLESLNDGKPRWLNALSSASTSYSHLDL